MRYGRSAIAPDARLEASLPRVKGRPSARGHSANAPELFQAFRSDKDPNRVNKNALVKQHLPPGVRSLRKVRLPSEVFCRHPSRIRGFCWRCADEFCDPQSRFRGSYMLVRGRFPYWLGSGSQSCLRSWSSPVTWMHRRPGKIYQSGKVAANCAALRLPFCLLICCDKACFFHVVRVRDVARSLYGSLQACLFGRRQKARPGHLQICRSPGDHW
jgi:hypothetical protein